MASFQLWCKRFRPNRTILGFPHSSHFPHIHNLHPLISPLVPWQLYLLHRLSPFPLTHADLPCNPGQPTHEVVRAGFSVFYAERPHALTTTLSQVKSLIYVRRG